MKEERKKKVIKFAGIVIVILLIILMHSCSQIDKINELIPTGNIDIYDINIDNSCDCECDCDKEIPEENKKSSSQISKNTDEVVEETPEEELPGAKILDSDVGVYKNTTKLNIFTNPAYEFKDVIAPLSSNVYQFVVRNNNEFNIKYRLIMNEINEYHINMKYRLKLDGKYVKGDSDEWVTYDELELEDLKLVSYGRNVYQLEWKWFESDDDTYIGTIDADYKLTISFDGVEI